jgi:putative ABC transport system permease protein
MNNFLFELRESMVIALRAIKANKVRSILTMLGIIIGIAAVVTMSTAIKGIDNSFQSGISSLGTDVLYVDKWAWFSNEEWWKLRNRKNITMAEYEKFRELAKLPIASAPDTKTNQTVKYGDRRVEGVFIHGSISEYIRTVNFDFDRAGFIPI